MHTSEIVRRAFIGIGIGIAWWAALWWFTFALTGLGHGSAAWYAVLEPALLIGPLVGLGLAFLRKPLGIIASAVAILALVGADVHLAGSLQHADRYHLERVRELFPVAVSLWYLLWYGIHLGAVLGLLFWPAHLTISKLRSSGRAKQ